MAKANSNGNGRAAKPIPAVGYVRMSTDQQQDSPARQRSDIQKLAQRMGY